jgi:hypothetical protein
MRFIIIYTGKNLIQIGHLIAITAGEDGDQSSSMQTVSLQHGHSWGSQCFLVRYRLAFSLQLIRWEKATQKRSLGQKYRHGTQNDRECLNVHNSCIPLPLIE